jgi:hypothetical protein
MVPSDNLLLPSLVVSPSDIGRLKREVEALNEYLRQADLRQGGEESAKLPRTSRMLDEFIAINKLNLLQNSDREAVLEFLDGLHKHAPVLHISFAADPSSAFTDKIITWLRQNINARVLLRIGLQPSIAAGCVVRTPNHYYDLSLRKHFAENRDLLIQKLESIRLPDER